MEDNMWSNDEVQKQVLSCSQIQNSIQSLLSNQADLTDVQRKLLLMSLYQKLNHSDINLGRVRAMNIKQQQIDRLLNLIELDQAFFKRMKTSYGQFSKMVKTVSQKDVDNLHKKYKKTLDNNLSHEIIEGFDNVFQPVNEELERETEMHSGASVDQFNENTKGFIEKISHPSLLDQIDENLVHQLKPDLTTISLS